MTVFSVDSDAVLATTAAVRGTIDRLQAETSAMHDASSTQLQASWTGHGVDRVPGASSTDWRTTQRQRRGEALGRTSTPALGARPASSTPTREQRERASLFRGDDSADRRTNGRPPEGDRPLFVARRT